MVVFTPGREVQSGGSTMVETQEAPGQSTRQLLVAAAVLEATAAVLGLAGLALCTVAVTTLTRQRVARMEIPPAELARRNWARARAATSAGVGAWRDMPVDEIRRGSEK
jgi:hypothetical protein